MSKKYEFGLVVGYRIVDKRNFFEKIMTKGDYYYKDNKICYGKAYLFQNKQYTSVNELYIDLGKYLHCNVKQTSNIKYASILEITLSINYDLSSWYKNISIYNTRLHVFELIEQLPELDRIKNQLKEIGLEVSSPEIWISECQYEPCE